MASIEVVVEPTSSSSASSSDHIAITIHPVIHVDYFSAKTFTEWMASDRTTFNFKSMNRTYHPGDAVVMVLDKHSVVGVAIIGGRCRPATEADRKIYSGEDSQYNAYVMQLRAHRILPEPFTFDDIRRFCGISEDDTTSTNIWNGRPGRGELYYAAKGVPSIYVARYKKLVNTWLP